MSERSLDEIMSERGNAPATIEAETPTPEASPSSQPRDETGKFAPKQGSAPEQPAVTETEPNAETEPAPKQGKVPLDALHAAREKGREEKNRADVLERQVAFLSGRVDAFLRAQQTAAPAQQAKPKDFWDDLTDDPEAAFRRRLEPIQQKIQQEREGMSRMLAEEKFGEDAVRDAYNAMAEALETDPTAKAAYEQIKNAPHPYRDLVLWNQRRAALADIGSDPNAYRERLRAELMAELQAQPAATQQPAARQPMPTSFTKMPSQGSRAEVAWQGPKPLSEITRRG